jgi:hypothetical protein
MNENFNQNQEKPKSKLEIRLEKEKKMDELTFKINQIDQDVKKMQPGPEKDNLVNLTAELVKINEELLQLTQEENQLDVVAE